MGVNRSGKRQVWVLGLLAVVIVSAVAVEIVMLGRGGFLGRPSQQQGSVALKGPAGPGKGQSQRDVNADDAAAAALVEKGRRSGDQVAPGGGADAGGGSVEGPGAAERRKIMQKILAQITPVMAKSSANPIQDPNPTTSAGKAMSSVPQTLQGDGVSPKKAKMIAQRIIQQKKWSINFPAKHPVANIVVFTDWTCPYCKKLQSHLAEINAAGISVHYLWYPRALALGKSSPRAQKTVAEMRNVMCQKDRAKAFTALYKGVLAPPTGCTKAEAAELVGEIEEHYALAEMLKITGTPFILTSSGDRFAGFSSAGSFIKKVKALAKFHKTQPAKS